MLWLLFNFTGQALFVRKFAKIVPSFAFFITLTLGWFCDDFKISVLLKTNAGQYNGPRRPQWTCESEVRIGWKDTN